MIGDTNHTLFALGGGIAVNRQKGKYAWTATVGETGQIVIPKQARDLFDIKPGDTILILGDEARGLAIPGKSTLEELNRTVFADMEENA